MITYNMKYIEVEILFRSEQQKYNLISIEFI